MKTITVLIISSVFFVKTLPASSLQGQNKAIAMALYQQTHDTIAK